MRNLDPKQIESAALAALRTNFFLFAGCAFSVVYPGQRLVRSDYIEALCFALQQVAEGHEKRLVVNLPPRYLKSYLAAIVLPCWVLGRRPTTQILVATYGETLAREHVRHAERLLSSNFYRQVFPGVRFEPVRGSSLAFRTQCNGGMRAVTVGGAATGIGADVIIVDDALKATDLGSEARRSEVNSYFDNTLLSRLNDKRTGVVIAIQQRLHQDDLPAHLLRKKGYKHFNLPAIAAETEEHPVYGGFVWERKQGAPLCPEREDLETLKAIKSDMGEAMFITQYQQDPASAGTSMIDLARLTLVGGNPEDHQQLKVIQTWDTAVKDHEGCDYSVCMTFAWDGERWLLIDVVRERLDFENLKAMALILRKRWSPEIVLVEDSANGTALRNHLFHNGFHEFRLLTPRGSKTERFAPAVEYLHRGAIGILHQCPWWPALRSELLSFPSGRYDDQVDALSLFVQKQTGRRPLDPQKPSGRLWREDHLVKRDRMEREYDV